MKNRILKFRAWDKENEEMIVLDDVCKEMLMRQAIWDRWHPKPCNGTNYGENIVFMQYTGLKDKNGKEIYEGDIIRKDSFSEGYSLPVIWRTPMFLLDEVGQSPLYEDERYEVIGNIYETNPS
jgi:hypothetical protein